jgi:DNA-binding MurR/RpiR family transcriptional regulator
MDGSPQQAVQDGLAGGHDRQGPPVGLAALPAELPHLTGSMQRIARTVLNDPTAAASVAASELARRAGTSTATVSRFARELGHTSFGSFQRALGREQAVAEQHRLPELAADIALDDDPATVVDKVLADMLRVVQDTRTVLDPRALHEVATRIGSARRLLLFGVGASGLVALDLGHKLERLGLPVWTAEERHRGLTLASTLTDEDVALCISHSGSTQETVAVAATAREHGAWVAALTGRPHGSLAQHAQVALLNVGGSERPLRPAATGSRLSQLAVVDALFVVVTQLTSERSGPLLAGSWSALRHTHEETGGTAR